jgi:hypothetical protein
MTTPGENLPPQPDLADTETVGDPALIAGPATAELPIIEPPSFVERLGDKAIELNRFLGASALRGAAKVGEIRTNRKEVAARELGIRVLQMTIPGERTPGSWPVARPTDEYAPGEFAVLQRSWVARAVALPSKVRLGHATRQYESQRERRDSAEWSQAVYGGSSPKPSKRDTRATKRNLGQASRILRNHGDLAGTARIRDERDTTQILLPAGAHTDRRGIHLPGNRILGPVQNHGVVETNQRLTNLGDRPQTREEAYRDRLRDGHARHLQALQRRNRNQYNKVAKRRDSTSRLRDKARNMTAGTTT